PYTTRNEEKLSAEILKHFSFAEEKLSELSDIACGKTNSELFEKNRVSPNGDVQNALKNLRDADFVRKPDFAEREKIQKKEFNLPPFPTTTIGSFPQTREVRKNRADFKKGVITKEQYVEFNRKKIAECIRLQEGLDIDVLVHGEFERNDMVEYFGNNLEGFLFTQNAWVQSYGTRCVKPPVIWSDVSRKNAITVEWSAYAQSLSKRPVKGMLTGPVTILNWSFPREDVPIKEQTLQIALAIRDEVLDLEKNGIRIIQIDEAALREKLPLRKSDWHSQYLDWAIPAFRLVHSGVKAETQIHTHMCYSEFNDIIRDIDEMDADVITFEASRSDLKILDALKEANFRTEVGPGVYDIHSPRIPSKEEIVSALEKMVQKEPVEKLWVNPDCGLKTRVDSETFESLKNLVAAAKEMRSKYDK
ncbi:MAG: 5-methyltetrahydropteroyltriglutamate--homocysteine S-methyltransferase, partial [Treponemataceae bacterium]|nr:5-methyltetrahydropteroyltriglutamate--homocysteine S-methyltransferase [Treponemataceae bacterium]